MVKHNALFSVQALRLFFGAALSLCVLSVYAQAAASFPNRPFTMVVPNATGGTNDIVGRVIASELAEEFKQSVVVVNKPGAGVGLYGLKEAQRMAKSEAETAAIAARALGSNDLVELAHFAGSRRH